MPLSEEIVDARIACRIAELRLMAAKQFAPTRRGTARRRLVALSRRRPRPRSRRLLGERGRAAAMGARRNAGRSRSLAPVILRTFGRGRGRRSISSFPPLGGVFLGCGFGRL